MTPHVTVDYDDDKEEDYTSQDASESGSTSGLRCVLQWEPVSRHHQAQDAAPHSMKSNEDERKGVRGTEEKERERGVKCDRLREWRRWKESIRRGSECERETDHFLCKCCCFMYAIKLSYCDLPASKYFSFTLWCHLVYYEHQLFCSSPHSTCPWVNECIFIFLHLSVLPLSGSSQFYRNITEYLFSSAPKMRVFM